MSNSGSNGINGRFDLFSAATSAEKRIAEGSGPTLKGTARGRMLELVGQQRPVFLPKKEEPPKPTEKPAEAAKNPDPKDSKPTDKKDEKSAEKAEEKKKA